MNTENNGSSATLLGLAILVMLAPTVAATTIDAPAPLAALQQALVQLEERTAKIVQAQKEVANAKQRVADLERRILASKNPLLAPPTVEDPATGADRLEWHGLSNAERVIRFVEMLDEARKELQRAERLLAGLRKPTTTAPPVQDAGR